MINIDDDYFIKADGLDYSAWVYVEGVNPKTKAPTKNTKLLGYYPNVIKALEAVKNYKIHKSIHDSVLSLEEAVKLITECEDKFIERLREQG